MLHLVLLAVYSVTTEVVLWPFCALIAWRIYNWDLNHDGNILLSFSSWARVLLLFTYWYVMAWRILVTRGQAESISTTVTLSLAQQVPQLMQAKTCPCSSLRSGFLSPASDEEIEKVERVREGPLSLVALYLCRLMISRMAWWTSARSFKSSRCVCLWIQCHFLLWACWREDAPLCASAIHSFYNTFNYCICVGCEWGSQKCDQSCSYERFVSFCDLVHQ